MLSILQELVSMHWYYISYPVTHSTPYISGANFRVTFLFCGSKCTQFLVYMYIAVFYRHSMQRPKNDKTQYMKVMSRTWNIAFQRLGEC